MKDGKIIPLSFSENLKVASMAGLINEDSALIWRGPLKHKAISQLASDVEWGKLDYLIVDLPPGTGDEHISAAQIIPDIAGAVIVSTPQQLSLMDALRAVDFCRKMNLKILGIIENMSGGVFGGGTVEKVCTREKIPFLGKIPLSETAVRSAEEGRPFLDYDEKELNRSFEQIVEKLGGCEK
jgi:ATP-binding protein involved in chromosome partitioning